MRLIPKLMFIAAVAMTGYHLGYHSTEKQFSHSLAVQHVAQVAESAAWAEPVGSDVVTDEDVVVGI